MRKIFFAVSFLFYRNDVITIDLIIDCYISLSIYQIYYICMCVHMYVEF